MTEPGAGAAGHLMRLTDRCSGNPQGFNTTSTTTEVPHGTGDDSGLAPTARQRQPLQILQPDARHMRSSPNAPPQPASPSSLSNLVTSQLPKSSACQTPFIARCSSDSKQ